MRNIDFLKGSGSCERISPSFFSITDLLVLWSYLNNCCCVLEKWFIHGNGSGKDRAHSRTACSDLSCSSSESPMFPRYIPVGSLSGPINLNGGRGVGSLLRMGCLPSSATCCIAMVPCDNSGSSSLVIKNKVGVLVLGSKSKCEWDDDWENMIWISGRSQEAHINGDLIDYIVTTNVFRKEVFSCDWTWKINK